MLIAQRPNPILTSVHRRAMRLMGIIFEISVVADNEIWANERIDNAFVEIARIEKLLANNNQQSQATLINNYAGVAPVKVNQEVYNLIDRSLKISELTHGAFDITCGSVDRQLWEFTSSMTVLPDAQTAKHAVRLVNYRNVILNPQNTTVFLKEKGMKIDFSGIGKGYVTDRVKYLLQIQGVSSGVVNATDNLITWGSQPNGDPWTVSAAAPMQNISPIANLNISNMAVVTSGINDAYAIINGKKYTQTIDPKTGLPVSGINSVSILSPSAELADAMGKPVMVMGVKVGLNLINRLNQVACIITNHRKKIYTSKNFVL